MKPIQCIDIDVAEITTRKWADIETHVSSGLVWEARVGSSPRIRVTEHHELIDGLEIYLAHKQAGIERISVGEFDYFNQCRNLWSIERQLLKSWKCGLDRCRLISEYKKLYMLVHPKVGPRELGIMDKFHRFPTYANVLGKVCGVSQPQIYISARAYLKLSDRTLSILRALPDISMGQLLDLSTKPWAKQTQIAQNMVDGIIKLVREDALDSDVWGRRLGRINDDLERGLGVSEDRRLRRDSVEALKQYDAAIAREQGSGLKSKPVSKKVKPKKPKKVKPKEVKPKEVKPKKVKRRVFKPLPIRNMFHD